MTDSADNDWDPERYDSETGFVADYGGSVVDLLDPQPGECVLDLGCGTGHLTGVVAERVADALAPGGRFVAELGGAGNVASILEAVLTELHGRGYEAANPWYFPTVGEHARLLEAHGFEVRHATLFDRPTELDGPEGLANWLDVFGDSLFAPLDDSEREAVVAAVEERLRESLYDRDSETWTADYRRLRFVAVR